MPLSRYLVVLPHPEKPELHLLFSTRTGGLALLPAASLTAVEAGAGEPELLETLRNLAMVADDLEAEKAEVHDYLGAVNRANPNLRVAVILGMACNFACPYCYEGSLKESGAAMSDVTAARLVEFLLARFAGAGGQSPKKNRLILDFYGGEPLLYLARIKSLARSLKPAIEAQGGRFEFTLVTNGSLLSREIVTELRELGLVSFKVTIDGPAEHHNRTRPCKDGSGSFARIVGNLAACRGIVPITLSGNYTVETYPAFPRLLDDLAGAGFGAADFDTVQFYPVMRVTSPFANPEFSGGCLSNDEPWVHKASLALREAIMARGHHFPPLHPSPCMIDLDDALVVHHDGTLYKCVVLIGLPEYACGDIWQGMNSTWPQRHAMGHWQQEEQCRDCRYLPLCFGGCRAQGFQRDGHMAKVDCQRSLYDATLPTILAQDLRYRYSA
ncbi:MAG: geopeptide radical SAM maturase [Thermodesulfobacteriota bacterium]